MSDDRIVVTGAGRGIGRATAVRLARHGHDVALWARTEADLAAANDEITRTGGRARHRVVDVADPDAVADAAGDLAADGPLRALVVNAGGGRWRPFSELTAQEWRATLATNLDGAFHVLRALLPSLAGHEHAQVIVVGSDSSLYPFPGRAHYCASKAALRSLAETFRAEVRPLGVRVTTLLPSRVDTHFGGRVPGDRPGALSAEDVADVIRFVIDLPPHVELRELRLSAITETYGPFQEGAAR
ncbi:SDR family oxidoreductase [Spongiactinospora sp. TRM90649]|uniref:SDR family oxidoreductase n=1 Tax=Spongiactinospora sp. TRM90649 TaxID=3031114 RepID=UPI0023F9C7CF|nr:SDR family oxidoreductase [Spongiactinospora sp. TRM90649]MDF5751641.1 SDR family NAD(P)-dependent oxidoreductase [Spongiactinospora sp. TRM90649]